jgi:hypothetical protein
MKKLIYILLGCLSLAAWYGCKKDGLANDYKKFYNGHEITYTGAVGAVVIQPGNLAIGLKWRASTDPSIVKYVVYYNNGADSQVVNITDKVDSIRTVIRNLQEYTYSFTIYSYDAKGNKSVPFEVNNAKAYGPVYAGNLLNRGYNATTPYILNNDGSLILKFITPDTINIKTIINYTNAAGVASQAVLLPQDSMITLPSYKLASAITYKSYFIPERNSLDTFAVVDFDTFPRIYTYVKCDKSKFAEVHLPQDVGTYESGTSISKLWDNSDGPQGYPNIFHSDGSYIPHVLTFDMGKSYDNLGQLEEVGRNCCNNPDQFEVWGINSLDGATTTLRADNSGWKAEAISKGWILLKQVVRTDDGINALKTDLLTNPPPVRYIRIRVLHTVTGSGYSNMSEVTFWNKQ